jgi:DNA-binding transcriptional MerR regulator
LRIGELSKLSGLAASRIRFYVAMGLLKAVKRRANGYRDYAPEALVTLGIIASAQSVGFSLEQVRNLLPLGQDNWKHDELLKALKQKIVDIEALQERLKENRAQLIFAIKSIENRPDGLTCADNTKRVFDTLRKRGVMVPPEVAARRGPVDAKLKRTGRRYSI